MDYEGRLAISYYQPVTVLNEAHQVTLVQHRETKKLYVKKVLTVYNLAVYNRLKEHPVDGIPVIYELYEEGQTLTVIEEYLSGSSLAEMIEQGGLTLALVFRIMEDLCRILTQLHSSLPPIIHRDIKPSNVIIDSNGHANLLDFNAAKFQNTDPMFSQDTDTTLLGTTGYAAPEQYGFGVSTTRTDFYGLGVLLKEMVDSLAPSDQLPGFGPIIESCTRLEPAWRMPDAKTLWLQLQELQDSREHTDTRKVTTLRNSAAVLDSSAAVQDSSAVQNPAAMQDSMTATGNLRKVSGFRRFLPPGFRTLTPWKMLVSLPVYFMVCFLSFTVTIEDSSGPAQIWVARIGILLWFLSIIFSTANYCGIQEQNPLYHHRNRLVRLLAVVLTDLLVSFAVFVCVVLAALIVS